MNDLLLKNVRAISVELGIDHSALTGLDESERLDSLLQKIAESDQLDEFLKIVMRRQFSGAILSEPTSNRSVLVQGSGGIVGHSITINAGQVAGGDIHTTYSHVHEPVFVRILKVVEREMSEASTPEAQKATEYVKSAIEEAQKPKPDKTSIEESLTKAGAVLDSVTDTAVKAGRLGSLLASALKALSLLQ